MHRRYGYLFGIFLVALMSLYATVGLAGSITKIPASDFNSATLTFYYPPKTYNFEDGDILKAEIDLSHLTFNTSTPGGKALFAFDEDPSEGVNKLCVVFFGSGVLQILYENTEIFQSSWMPEKTYTIRLKLAEDGANTEITVYEGNDLKWEGEVSGLTKVAVVGAGGQENSVIDGYAEITWHSEMQLIDMDWAMALVCAIVPVFVIVALLKALLKPLERV